MHVNFMPRRNKSMIRDCFPGNLLGDPGAHCASCFDVLLAAFPSWGYPLVNVYIANWKIIIYNR